MRIPNIFFMCCTAAALTANVLPNATLATRYEFATTGGGVLDIDKACFNWYMNLNQPYSLTFSYVGVLTTLIATEIAAPIVWSHVGVGQEAAVSTFGLSMSLCFAGGTMSNCTWTRATLASSGHYVNTLTDMTGFTVTNERIHALGGARGNATTGAATLTRVASSSWTGSTRGGGRTLMTTCTDDTFTTTTYYDHPATTTPVTNAMSVFDLSTNCLRIKMDGISFGGLTLCQPYGAILNVGAAGCTDIKLRNLGTAASPLDMGGAYVDATWTRSTTTMTVTKTAHGLKTNDVIAVNIVSDTAPKAVTTTTATLWTVASAPTADTFTVTVTNAGAASGTMSYYPCMTGTLVILAASAAASSITVQRCYTPHLRTGLFSGDNSSKNIRFDNCWGTEWGVQLVPELNCTMRGIQSTPALTAQTSCYGTHWADYFTTGTPANLSGVSWTRSTTTATITSTGHGLRTGDLIHVSVTSDASAIILGQKTITATTANAFTFTCLNAGAASGTLTFVPMNSRIAIQMNEPTTDTTAQYTADAGTPGFTSAGSLYMPAVNDQVTFEMPNYTLCHESFIVALPTMAGGTIGNHDLTYAIDKNDGNGYSSYKNLAYPRAGGGGTNGSFNVTMTDTTGVAVGDYVFGTNIAPRAKVDSITNGTTVVVDKANTGTVSGVLTFDQLPNESISPSLGFKLKLRVKTTTTNVAAITSIYIPTTSTSSSRAYTYPIDLSTLTVTVLDSSLTAISSARIRVTSAQTIGTLTTGDVLATGTTDGSGVFTAVIPMEAAFGSALSISVRVRKATGGTLYKASDTPASLTLASGASVTIVMVADQ